MVEDGKYLALEKKYLDLERQFLDLEEKYLTLEAQVAGKQGATGTIREEKPLVIEKKTEPVAEPKAAATNEPPAWR